MFARHPLEPLKDRLEERDLVDALRLAIIAELDAISFYLQVASRAARDDVRRVFEDVAREEKTHVGEFLEMLKRLDPEQAEELEKGAREVYELTGVKSVSSNNGGLAPGGEMGEENRLESIVSKVFSQTAEAIRVLRKKLPVTILGPGVDSITVSRVAAGSDSVSVEEEVVTPLHEVSVAFAIPQRLVERSARLGEPLEPIVEAAARTLVSREERLVVSEISGASGTLEAAMGSWEKPGEAVEDVAKAVAMLEAEGFRGPFVLLLPPQRYARLLAVHEKTGVMELSRVRELAEPVRTPYLEDQAILVAAEKSGLDIVIGVDTRVDHLGLEDGRHRFRAWETLAVRVSNPRAIVKLRPSSG